MIIVYLFVFDRVGVQSALPDLVDVEDAVSEYNSLLDSVSFVQKFGVLAMHITTTVS